MTGPRPQPSGRSHPHGARRPAGVGAWLAERTGYRSVWRAVMGEPVRGGASFAYVFGALLLFLIGNQALTGVLLAAFYAPSASDAWASVAYVQDQVWLGWFIRGLHGVGASALVPVMLLHLLQVTIYGSYRAPREVTFWSGLCLGALVMALALTGYLLPWDQKGYWATQVATTLLGAVPLLGRALQVLLQGGPQYGNLTLTHFYALHTLVLPGLLLLLIGAHLWLFRRHGVTPRWGQSREELKRTTEPFWPRQAVYDLGAAAVLLLCLCGFVVRAHGVDLEAPADPAAPYDARPEWYFLPLYQILKYFPGPLEIVAALGLPLLCGGALFALPLWDRGPSRDPRQRRGPLLLVAAGLVLLGVLGGVAAWEDRTSAAYQRNAQVARAAAARARSLALKGVLPEGGTAVYLNDPLEQGRRVFVEHCAGCHRLGLLGPAAEKDVKGPELTGFGGRAWLTGFLLDPNGLKYFGRTKIHGMKALQAPPEDRRALVEYVYSLSGAKDVDAQLAQRGAGLFDQRNCVMCHELDGRTEGEGPNLKDHTAAPWVRGLLLAPDAAVYFGGDSDMPAFGKKLTGEELDNVAAFVAAQKKGS